MDDAQALPREVGFPGGEMRCALGLGMYGLGADPARTTDEVRLLRQALEIGYRVFDTAEMYAQGGSERVLGQALAQAQRAGLRREELFVVSKVLPENASAAGVVAACERSLQRLGLDRIDLYLLHWRGATPLTQTVQGFEQLLRRDCIRRWGVSNFDLADMQELMAVPGGTACAANQVHYSPSARGVEWDLLPWQCQQGMPLMAYSPFDQGDLVNHPALQELARRHQATPAQIALAWVLRQPGVMAIPKAGRALHLQLNWAAPRLVLSPQDLAEMDRSFVPPRRKIALSMR
jgi:diketogulonate reductase-like aldo/keto reductase